MSMYGLIWRLLPGPTAVKVVEAALLIALVIAVLFQWVFPQLALLMPFNDSDVGG